MFDAHVHKHILTIARTHTHTHLSSAANQRNQIKSHEMNFQIFWQQNHLLCITLLFVCWLKWRKKKVNCTQTNNKYFLFYFNELSFFIPFVSSIWNLSVFKMCKLWQFLWFKWISNFCTRLCSHFWGEFEFCTTLASFHMQSCLYSLGFDLITSHRILSEYWISDATSELDSNLIFDKKKQRVTFCLSDLALEGI